MSGLRQEIVESQKFRGEMIKWKLVICATLGAIGLGLSGGTNISFSVFGGLEGTNTFIVLALMPIACVYCDAACLHTNLRIAVIGSYSASDASHEDYRYEQFVGKFILADEKTPGDVDVFEIENLVISDITKYICFSVMATGFCLLFRFDAVLSYFLNINQISNKANLVFLAFLFIGSCGYSFWKDRTIRKMYLLRMQKIADAAKEFRQHVTDVAVLKINNSDIRKLVRLPRQGQRP
jgi:hypothetical protein